MDALPNVGAFEPKLNWSPPAGLTAAELVFPPPNGDENDDADVAPNANVLLDCGCVETVVVEEKDVDEAAPVPKLSSFVSVEGLANVFVFLVVAGAENAGAENAGAVDDTVDSAAGFVPKLNVAAGFVSSNFAPKLNDGFELSTLAAAGFAPKEKPDFAAVLPKLNCGVAFNSSPFFSLLEEDAAALPSFGVLQHAHSVASALF